MLTHKFNYQVIGQHTRLFYKSRVIPKGQKLTSHRDSRNSNIIKLEDCIEMPVKKPEVAKESTETLLRLGKGNNVIVWAEQVRRAAGVEYGLLSSFLTTNVRYFIPIPMEVDYLPQFPPLVEGQAAHPLIPAALAASLRQGAYDRRTKKVEQQVISEQKIHNMM